MKTFRFDPNLGRHIKAYGSDFTLSGLAQPNEKIHVGCARLEPGGLIGYHPATVPQLFIVIAGEGWVRGENEEVPIGVGGAAFWQAGENHAARTDTGLTALIIETDAFEESQFPAVEDSTSQVKPQQ